MDLKCPDCDSWHWRAECLTSSTNTRLKFGVCCISGKIQLPKLNEPPQPLRNLLESQDHKGKAFRENIHQYNAALAFTSLGAKLDCSVTGNSGGPYVFKIHGELYHHQGALLPEDGGKPLYAQLYIYDPSEALRFRQRNNDGALDSETSITSRR